MQNVCDAWKQTHVGALHEAAQTAQQVAKANSRHKLPNKLRCASRILEDITELIRIGAKRAPSRF